MQRISNLQGTGGRNEHPSVDRHRETAGDRHSFFSLGAGLIRRLLAYAVCLQELRKFVVIDRAEAASFDHSSFAKRREDARTKIKPGDGSSI